MMQKFNFTRSMVIVSIILISRLKNEFSQVLPLVCLTWQHASRCRWLCSGSLQTCIPLHTLALSFHVQITVCFSLVFIVKSYNVVNELFWYDLHKILKRLIHNQQYQLTIQLQQQILLPRTHWQKLHIGPYPILQIYYYISIPVIYFGFHVSPVPNLLSENTQA